MVRSLVEGKALNFIFCSATGFLSVRADPYGLLKVELNVACFPSHVKIKIKV